jgi:hypothetical protein
MSSPRAGMGRFKGTRYQEGAGRYERRGAFLLHHSFR